MAMPEHGENRKDCSDFDTMSTESLEKLLYLDSQLTGEEALDVDVILYILEVIDSRRKETPAPQVPSPDVDKAWDTFRKKYFPNLSKSNGQSFYEYDDEPSSKNISHSTYERTISPPHPKKKRLLHVAYAAAIIAALLCIMTATASALGYDLWGALAQWSEETFSFTSKQEIDTQNTDVKDFTERTVNNSYKNIQDALNDYGITEPLVPTWFPDGYSLAEVKVKEFSKTKLTFDACYKCDDKTIAICVKKYENIDDMVERSQLWR